MPITIMTTMHEFTLLHRQRISQVICVAAWFLGFAGQAEPADRVDWRPPENHFKGVDEEGFVSCWDTLANIDFGDGLWVPLHVHFNSAPTAGAGLLGAGWTVPLLESKFTRQNVAIFSIIDSGGKSRTFRASTSSPGIYSGKDGWTAIEEQDSIEIKRPDGWSMTFRKQRLNTFVSPRNHTYQYVYASGRLRGIQQGARLILTVEYDEFNTASSFTFNGVRAAFLYSERPRFLAVGNGIQLGNDRALHRSLTESSAERVIDYKLSKYGNPTISVSYAGSAQTWEWDRETMRIVRDSVHRYSVTVDSPEKGTIYVARMTDDSLESRFVDPIRGIQEVISKNGTRTGTRSHTSGILIGRPWKKWQQGGGGFYIESEWLYDDLGRCVKVQSSDATSREYVFRDHHDYREVIYLTNGGITETRRYNALGKLMKRIFSNGTELTFYPN